MGGYRMRADVDNEGEASGRHIQLPFRNPSASSMAAAAATGDHFALSSAISLVSKLIRILPEYQRKIGTQRATRDAHRSPHYFCLAIPLRLYLRLCAWISYLSHGSL